MQRPDPDTVLAHLREISRQKSGMLEIALAISEHYPNQSLLLFRMIKQLTRSADTLLGDTRVLSVGD